MTRTTTTQITIDKAKLQAFKAQNAHFDLRTFNFFDTSALETLQALGEDPTRALLLEQLRGLQRLAKFIPQEDHAIYLHDAGYHSCFHISELSQHQFVQEHGTVLGQEQAQHIHKQALARKEQLVLHYMNLHGQTGAHYRATLFDNSSEATDENYSGLPSYADLFGGLDFCTCEHCRSIFSPAAYLVDLLRFKRQQIDDSKQQPGNKLFGRRPDLENLELSCENTNTAVPKLHIVNEVLVDQVASRNDIRGTGDTTEEQEEEDKRNKVFKHLSQSTEKYPFTLPFNLPLTQVRAYLKYLKTDLPSIWTCFTPPAQQQEDNKLDIAREVLCISAEEYKLYTTTDATKDGVNSAYGLDKSAEPLDFEKGLGSIDIFLAQTGLTYDQLTVLINGDLNEDEIDKKVIRNFFINNTGEGDPITIDQDNNHNNQLKQLTLKRLDRIHRFIRLAHKTGLSFPDLNWVLQSQGLQENSSATDKPNKSDKPGITYQPAEIDNTTIQILAQLVKWQKAYPDQSINALNTLVAPMKNFGCHNVTKQSFFEQVYHITPQTKLQLDKDWCVHDQEPCNDAKVQDKDLIRAQLQGALGISEGELNTIGEQIQAVTAPAAIEFNGVLYCFYKKQGDNTIHYRYTTKDQDEKAHINIKQVSDGKQLALLRAEPAVIEFNKQLCCFFHGQDGLIYYYMSKDPTQYDSWTDMGTITCADGHKPQLLYSPALAVFNDTLYCFYTQPSSADINYTSIAYVATSTNALTKATKWDNHKTLTDNSGEIPEITTSPSVVVFEKKLCCFFGTPTANGDKGLLTGLLAYSYTATPTKQKTWAKKKPVGNTQDSEGYATFQRPTLTVFRGSLFCFFNDIDAKDADSLCLYYCHTSGLDTTWTYAGRIEDATRSKINMASPTAVVYEFELHCFYISADDNIHKVHTKTPTKSDSWTTPQVLTSPIKLTLEILSALYRMSLITKLTQHTVHEVLDMLMYITGSSENDTSTFNTLVHLDDPLKAAHTFHQLTMHFQWLQQANIQDDVLKCILQPSVPASSPLYLGQDDKINFVNTLYEVLQSTLLTEKVLQCSQSLKEQQAKIEALEENKVIDKSKAKPQYKTLADNLWEFLAPGEKQYFVTSHGIVQSIPNDNLLVKEIERWFPMKDSEKEATYNTWKQQLKVAIQALLTHYYQLQVNTYYSQIASQFDVPGYTVSEIIQLVKVRLQKEGRSLLQDLLAPVFKLNRLLISTDVLPVHIHDILYNLQRYSCLTSRWKLNRVALRTLIANPSFYNIVANTTITLQDLQHLFQYRQLVSQYQDTKNTLIRYFVNNSNHVTKQNLISLLQADNKLQQVDILWTALRDLNHINKQGVIQEAFSRLKDAGEFVKALNNCPTTVGIDDAQQTAVYRLLQFFSAPRSSNQAAIDLAKLTQWDNADNPKQLTKLFRHLFPAPKNEDPEAVPGYATLKGILQVQQCITQSNQIGIDIDSLIALYNIGTTEHDAQYSAWMQISHMLLRAIQSKYNDTSWSEVCQPIQLRLNERIRDVLVPTVMYSLQKANLPIHTHRDLYEYLLIDVDVSGLVETSRIKEAIGCLQLYVSRCRMNLEKDITFPDKDKLEEYWAWIHSYRVWEANRKTFLYPENYISPELRANATPMFKSLVSTLEQGTVSKASVTKTVKMYLNEFADIANLKYAGSYLAYPGDDAAKYNRWSPIPGWRNVTSVPNTMLKYSPAAVTFNNKLYCFHRGDGDNSLWFNYYDGTEWQGDSKISGCRTNITPAVVVWNNTLYCFHCAASDSTIWYVCSKTPNIPDSWQTKQINSGAITTNSKGLSVVVFEDKLYCFYGRRDKDDEPTHVYYCYQDIETENWEEEQLAGILNPGILNRGEPDRPSLASSTHPAVVVSNQQIFCFYRVTRSCPQSLDC